MDGLKQGGLVYNWVTTSEEPFQSGSTAIMIVDEVSYREI